LGRRSSSGEVLTRSEIRNAGQENAAAPEEGGSIGIPVLDSPSNVIFHARASPIVHFGGAIYGAEILAGCGPADGGARQRILRENY
jgi:hypothetical protein